MNKQEQREVVSGQGREWGTDVPCLPAPALSILEQLFPGWVISQCDAGHRPHFLSRNSAAFFGVSPDELAAKTYDDFMSLIHPDVLDSYQRSSQKASDVLKSIDPTEVFQYRFTIQYRLRRRKEYLSLHEERLFYLDEHDCPIHYILFRDLSAERSITRVQLDWYKVHELGYQRVGSYVPAAPEQDLTAREVEVVQLIKKGLSSKEIADRLCISVNTVRNHRSNLFRKTNARNMVDLLKNTARPERVN
ncbi:helix-turn-helix transcriptional regulator [Spirosoma arcticum]